MKNFGLEVCSKAQIKTSKCSHLCAVAAVILLLLPFTNLSPLLFFLFHKPKLKENKKYKKIQKTNTKKLFWLLFMSTFMLLSLDGWIKFPHNNNNNQTQHKLYNFLYLCFFHFVHFSFSKIKELIMEGFKTFLFFAVYFT